MFSMKLYYNYSERIVENTAIRVHYTMEKMSKLTVTKINCLEVFLQYLFKTILYNGTKLA